MVREMGREKKMVAACFRRKSPDPGQSWVVFLNVMDNLIKRMSSLVLNIQGRSL